MSLISAALMKCYVKWIESSVHPAAKHVSLAWRRTGGKEMGIHLLPHEYIIYKMDDFSTQQGCTLKKDFSQVNCANVCKKTLVSDYSYIIIMIFSPAPGLSGLPQRIITTYSFWQRFLHLIPFLTQPFSLDFKPTLGKDRDASVDSCQLS